MATSKRVLLVEDDPARGGKLEQLVREAGLRCVRATSAGAAKGTLKQNHFAAILLDYQLGDADGDTVVPVICATQGRDCEVLIHSQSASGARIMRSALVKAGFLVWCEPWCEEARGKIKHWLELRADEDEGE